MITREFNLYLHAGHSIPLVINVNQYDYGERWLFTLFNSDGTQYIPSSGAIVGIKADNLGIINTGSVVDGKVAINETQQMTAAVGKATFELLIDDQTHGTANFIVLVEPKPGDQADLSESDLSLLQQAIDGTSATAIAQGVSDWMDDNLTPTTPVVDASLTVSGAAADAKKTGDEISELKSQISTLSAIPHEVKLAMDTLFQKMAVIDDERYFDEWGTIHAWATAVNLVSISAVFEQGDNTVYATSSLDDLRQYLIVTATYDDGTEGELATYTLSGTLSVGTSVITVSAEEKNATFNVTVSNGFLYTPDKGLLSDQSYITTSGLENITESITGGVLNLYSPANSAEPTTIFYITPTSFTNFCKLKYEFNCADSFSASSTNTTHPGAVNIALSTGEEALSVGTIRYNTSGGNLRLRYPTATGSYAFGTTNITFNTWHTLECIAENGEYTVKLDGVTEVSNQSLVGHTWANRLQVRISKNKANNMSIRKIELQCD